MSMGVVLDRLAGAWLDWRVERFVKKSGMSQFTVPHMEIKQGSMEIAIRGSAVPDMADSAAAMLDQANAKNYVTFDMLPRADHGYRPIRVTVQWVDGMSPGVKAGLLLDALRKIKETYHEHWEGDDCGERMVIIADEALKAVGE